MKTLNYCLLVLFLFLGVALNAQDVSAKKLGDKKNNYNLIIKDYSDLSPRFLYQGKSFKKKQLREILMNDQLAFNFYEEYESRSRTSKVFWGMSGGFAIISLAIFASIETEGDLYNNIGIGLISALGSLCSVGAAIGTTVSGEKRLNKSIDFFNGNIKNKENLGVVPMQLNLQSTQNGIGLVLSF